MRHYFRYTTESFIELKKRVYRHIKTVLHEWFFNIFNLKKRTYTVQPV